MNAPTILSIAIVGKNDEPIYLKEFLNNTNSTTIDFISNSTNTLGKTKIEKEEEELFGIVSVDKEEKEVDDNNNNCSLRQQFLLHEVLDRFDHLAGPPTTGRFISWKQQQQQLQQNQIQQRTSNANTPTTNAAGAVSAAIGTDAMFIGFLSTIEETRIYGYMTTTRIKFILIIEDDDICNNSNDTGGTLSSSNNTNSTPSTNVYNMNTNNDIQVLVDERIQSLLVNIHNLYVEYTLNPFNIIHGQHGGTPSMMISSSLSSSSSLKRFDNGIKECISSFYSSFLSLSV